MTLKEMIRKNQFLTKTHSQDFRRIFGTSLEGYMHHLFGFDIVLFDKQYIQSGDGCMMDIVMSRYGEDGVNMTENLIYER